MSTLEELRETLDAIADRRKCLIGRVRFDTMCETCGDVRAVDDPEWCLNCRGLRVKASRLAVKLLAAALKEEPRKWRRHRLKEQSKATDPDAQLRFALEVWRLLEWKHPARIGSAPKVSD